ncbi:MAG TPA: heavy metal-responsive transcriptional regulator [Nitrospiraceae bacterium]|nr:heavy metal-responsive transcriptional regulator [Nitrospiraceae bacterium]
MKPLFIGKIAKQAGVPIKTIRYYEEVGLLSRAGRTSSGYRTYAFPVIDRLVFIKKAQTLGLTLKDIKSILDLADRGGCPCGHVQHTLKQSLQGLRQKIADLQEIEKKLVGAMRQKCPTDFRPSGSAICPKIQQKPKNKKVVS